MRQMRSERTEGGAAKKAITVKWKPQVAMMPKVRISGYQVQCSPVRSFKSGTKQATANGYKKKSVKVKGLKAKTTYYVRVRTVMKVGGRTYYSTWSNIMAVKTK